MKKMKFNFFVIGFLVGVVYVAACGDVGQSIADAIGDAVDVMFDNSSSGLAATDMQSAVDELDGRVDNLEGTSLGTLLVGTWTGSEFCNRCGTSSSGETTGLSFTFNADGTYSCTIADSSFSGIDDICDSPVSWTVLKKTIKVTFQVSSSSCAASSSSDGSSTSTCTGGSTSSRIAVFPVHYIDSTSLEIIDNDDDAGLGIVELTKS